MRLSAQNRFSLNNISNVPLFIPEKWENYRKKDDTLVRFAHPPEAENGATMKGWNMGTKDLDSNTEVMRF